MTHVGEAFPLFYQEAGRKLRKRVSDHISHLEPPPLVILHLCCPRGRGGASHEWPNTVIVQNSFMNTERTVGIEVSAT